MPTAQPTMTGSLDFEPEEVEEGFEDPEVEAGCWMTVVWMMVESPWLPELTDEITLVTGVDEAALEDGVFVFVPEF